MNAAEFAVNFFVALFALIDPVGNVPLFAAVFMSFFFLTGLALLKFFGISLPAFRIAGGILLLLMGLDMARGDTAETMTEASEEVEQLSTRAYARKRFEGMIVPFAMPLLIGPGAISTAVIYAGESKAYGLVGTAAGLATIAAVCLTVLVAFWSTGWITRVLGRIGMVIVIRVLGLILCAMAVQFILQGLADSTFNLVRRGVAIPYQ